MPPAFFIPFLYALLTAMVLGWPAHLVLRSMGVIDKPNARSSHLKPTVRGGGVSIIATILGAIGLRLSGVTGQGGGVTSLATIAAAVAVLSVVSFCDDLRSVGARVRFSCHAMAAVSVLVVLGMPATGTADSANGAVINIALAVVGFLWIAGYTNAFNFMDGINGLAAGQAVVTGLATSGLALAAGLPVQHPVVWLALVVAGAAAGFLPHNFPRARMFMGDVSSAPLGFLLATLGWWLACEAGWWLLLPVGLLHANFVLDTGITLARRVLRGERWYEAHREHFYQRLVRSGRSHSFVTGWELGLQLVAAAAVMVATLTGAGGWLVASAVLTVSVWLMFFLKAEKIFRDAKV